MSRMCVRESDSLIIYGKNNNPLALLYQLLYQTFGESGLLENEPTVPAEQAHTTLRQ